jgi:G:T-mismatch repair DNA endonuclease (very short patch repair protein)
VGAVERVNATLMNKIRKLSNFNENNLTEVLKRVTLAVNVSYNRSIGTSPFVVMYGKQPKFVFEASFDMTNQEVDMAATKNKRDEHWNRYAKRNIEKGRTLITMDMNVGDNVMIFKKPMSNKFSRNWWGGYWITDIIPPDAYLVTDGKRRFRVNKKHIKIAH